ncbi:hypothetical protein ACFQ60_05060 [Streptomyces zhihengii]
MNPAARPVPATPDPDLGPGPAAPTPTSPTPTTPAPAPPAVSAPRPCASCAAAQRSWSGWPPGPRPSPRRPSSAAGAWLPGRRLPARSAATGLLWLGGAALAILLGAPVVRGVFAQLPLLTEPLRDALVRRSVVQALATATADTTGRAVDATAVSRLTSQTEIARDSFAGLVLAARSFVFVAAGALAGLVSLAPSSSSSFFRPWCWASRCSPHPCGRWHGPSTATSTRTSTSAAERRPPAPP